MWKPHKAQATVELVDTKARKKRPRYLAVICVSMGNRPPGSTVRHIALIIAQQQAQNKLNNHHAPAKYFKVQRLSSPPCIGGS